MVEVLNRWGPACGEVLPPGQGLSPRSGRGDSRGGSSGTAAVSEALGALILAGVVVTGMVIVGVILLSQPTPSKVPVFDAIISNRSKTIYLYHKGGDPLYRGEYQILVDGVDRTGLFVSDGDEPWSVGKTLNYTSPAWPRRVLIILNYTGGGMSVLAGKTLTGSTVIPDASSSWFFNTATGTCNWIYRKKITIDRTKVQGSLTNFPVLVSLGSDPELAAKAQKDGDDIVFTSSDGTTKLNHEIESWMWPTGTLVAWVKVPSLSSASDTVLYLYYGNATSASQQSAANVWDGNYMAVWHLSEVVANEVLSSPAHYDSTSPQENGAQRRNDDAPGKINLSQYFDGTVTYDWINVGDDNDIDMAAGVDFTLSAWVNTTQPGVAGTWPAILRKIDDDGTPNDGYGLYLHSNSNGKWYFEIEDEGTYYSATGNNQINDSAWHYIAGVRSGATLLAYEDGNPAGTNPAATSAELEHGYDLRLGASCEAAPGAGKIYTGNIDEVRISKTVRSPDWIRTEYNNQNSPSTFSALGTEESWFRC